MYAVVRARFAVLVSPKVRVETGILRPISLNSLVVLLGDSGIGKTVSQTAGPTLVDFGAFTNIFESPLGSGEGLAELYLSPPVKGQPSRAQVMEAGLFTLDEGHVLHQLAQRNGATLMSELRKAYSGAVLGQGNAGAATRRHVAVYRLVLLANMQPVVAAKLLGDHLTGDPQRFVFFATTDPAVPDAAPAVSVPTVPRPTHGGLVTVAPSIQAEVRARRLPIVRGVRRPDPLDSHRDQNRLVEATLLSLMEGRTVANEDDWHRAGMVMDVSDRLRRQVMAEQRAQRDAEEARRGRALGVREAAAEDEKERRLVAKLAERIADKVVATGGMARGELRKAVTSAVTRHRFDPALTLAVAGCKVKVIGDRVEP